MSDAYYTTPGYAPTGTEMPMTPAQRYQQMLAKNPLQLGLEQRGPSYSYYGPYNGGYAPVPLPLAKGQPANSYDAYAAVAPQSEDPPVDNPTSPPPPPPPPVDNPTSPPPPPPPPPTTTPAGPQSFKKLQPQIQGAMQSAFKDYLNNTVGQKSNGSFPNLFGVLDQFALKRPKPPSSTPTSPPTSPPPPPPPPPADAPQKSSALSAASFPTSGSGGTRLLLSRPTGPTRLAAGGVVTGQFDGGWNPSQSDLANAQPMPMPSIPAGMPMPRQRLPMPQVDPSKMQNLPLGMPGASGSGRPPPLTAAPGGGGAPPPVLGGQLPSYGDPGFNTPLPPYMPGTSGGKPWQGGDPGSSQGQGNAWGRNRPAGMKPFDVAGFGGRGPSMSRMGRSPLR